MAIGIGGVVGVSARWALGVAVGPTSGFHSTILIVNLVGCFVLGLLLAIEVRSRRNRILLHDFGAIGFCGGLTTMSSFAVDVVGYLDAGKTSTAAVYLTSNVVGGFALLVLGAVLAKRVFAIELPVEERP